MQIKKKKGKKYKVLCFVKVLVENSRGSKLKPF